MLCLLLKPLIMGVGEYVLRDPEQKKPYVLDIPGKKYKGFALDLSREDTCRTHHITNKTLTLQARPTRRMLVEVPEASG